MKADILVIEDNAQNMYLLTFLLEKNGYTVIQAVDGADAIEMAQLHRPDIILLDIQLPGMTGYEVARLLRDDPAFADLPIIAVTSYAMPGDKDKAMASGCTGYIEKPIDPATFINDFRQWISPDNVNKG